MSAVWKDIGCLVLLSNCKLCMTDHDQPRSMRTGKVGIENLVMLSISKPYS